MTKKVFKSFVLHKFLVGVRISFISQPSCVCQVVRAFDSLATEDLSNGMKVGESEVFNSAQQSAEIRWFRRMAFGSQNCSTDFFTQNDSNSREAHDQC